MAPRMKLPVSKRREAPVQSKRRTKARSDRGRPPQLERSPSPPRQAPSAPSPTPRSTLFASRIVSMGRRIDFNFLEHEGFEIGRLLKEMGWEFICSLNLPTYLDLVREFYENENFAKGSLESVVKGVQIHITDAMLGDIIRAPSEGEINNHLEDRAEGVKLILNKDEASEFEEVPANQLSAQMRLLHHMINRLLFLKTGRFDYVSERDILVMHHVLLGQPLNLPSLMIDHMIDLGRRKRGSLPYGMVLTLVFNLFGVNLEGENKKELLHTDIYNDRSLKRIGFVKVGGEWIHKGEGRPEMPREQVHESPSDEHHEEELPPPQAPRSDAGASSSSQSIRLDQDQLKEVIDHVLAGLLASGFGSNQSTSPALEARLDRLILMISQQQERMESFEEQMRALRIEVGNSTRATETGGQEILHALQQLTNEVRHVGGSIGASLTILTTLITRLLSESRSSQRTPPGPPPSSSQPPPPPGPSSSSSYPRITELD